MHYNNLKLIKSKMQAWLIIHINTKAEYPEFENDASIQCVQKMLDYLDC